MGLNFFWPDYIHEVNMSNYSVFSLFQDDLKDV